MKCGDTIEFYDSGWRVGVYDRTVERGKKFGLVQVRVTVPSYERKVFVRPDEVRELKGGQG